MSDQKQITVPGQAAQKRGRGRPKYVPSDEDRQAVEILAGMGMTQERIAKLFKISEVTLNKVYRDELDKASATVEGNLIKLLLNVARGKDGNALNAIKFMLQCRFGWSQYTPAPAPMPEKKVELGKKEQANIDAQTAHESTPWAELLH